MLAIVLLVAPGTWPTAALAQDTLVERAATNRPYAAHVADAARRFGVPEAWIWAVMRVESRGDPRAVSPAGAMGLMQLMPATWAAMRARYGLGRDPFDPRDNIMAGAAYLRAMYDRYGDTAAMLAAYNAGPGRYDDYRARGRPLPAETIAYVTQIAPAIGGAADMPIAAAPPPDPFAWRRAALFTVRLDGATQRGDGAADPRPEAPSDDRSVSVVVTVAPRSSGLFVPLSGPSRQ